MTYDIPTDMPSDIPSAWKTDLTRYTWSAQTIGRSDASVFRLDAGDRPPLFVKTEAATAFGELPAEAARLRWLSTNGIACPQVLDEICDSERNWLLMTAIPGQDLASSPGLKPAQIVEIAADALRALHRLDIASCPFDRTLDRTVAEAGARTKAGLVDEADFDEARLGRTAQDVFSELLQRRPDAEDLVVVHGDASLPNLLANAQQFTGFIDCARLGIADRHVDLAIASWSVQYNLGEAWVEPFLRRYGAATDPERMDYYLLLDEFF